MINVFPVGHLQAPLQSAREDIRLFGVKQTEIDENRKMSHFHSPHHEIRADRTQIFHGSFDSCVLRRLVKENRGVLNLFREISIETRVFFCVLHATSPPSQPTRNRCVQPFSSASNVNPRAYEHVAPLPTEYRRGFAVHRRVSLNNTHIREKSRNPTTERAIPTQHTLSPLRES